MKKGTRLEEIVTKTDFEATYQYPKKAGKALAKLEDAGIFPLTFENPKLAFLNVLGLYVYLSGSLEIKNDGSYDARIANNGLQLPLNELESQLGISFRQRPHGRLALGKNGAPYARLLSLMGFHTSVSDRTKKHTKATIGSSLPPYLVECIDGYPNHSRRIRWLTAHLIRDFISVWFDTKGYVNSKDSVNVGLLSQPSEQVLLEQARLYMASVNALYPNINLGAEAVNVYRQKNRGTIIYTGNVKFTLEQVMGFPKRGRIPVGIQIVVTPRYYFNRF